MTKDEGPTTISDAAPLIRAGELTPSALLEQCLARVDVYEPAVKAWAYLDRERARRDAGRLTDELKRGQYRGPLHGIPVGVKDIIDVFDMPTGCGSKRWADSYARKDAAAVERLRQAGAVIVGKTVTTPYAYLDPPPTRNPWNLDRTPGGSSSGSAAAVACGMVLAALGTQTGGSTIRPASYCGVCALKPTHGRISVDGVLPLAPSLDHVGVMANCVRDLAAVFQAVVGPGPGDGSSYHWGPAPDIGTRFDALPAEVDELADVHMLTGPFAEGTTAELRGHFDRALHRGQSNDFFRKSSVPPPSFAELPAAMAAIYAVEAATVHGDRLDRRSDDYPANIRRLVETGRQVSGTDYRTARVFRDAVEHEVTQLLGGRRCFLTPATTDLPPAADTTGSPAMNSPWSFTGHPVVSVPAGWSDDGLPFAVQLVGRPHREADLLVVAAWYEGAFALPWRRPPVT